MDTNVVSDNCSNGGDFSGTTGFASTDFGSDGFSGNGIASVTTAPEPNSFLLLTSGLLGALFYGLRLRRTLAAEPVLQLHARV
jgi:hypothetical protein